MRKSEIKQIKELLQAKREYAIMKMENATLDSEYYYNNGIADVCYSLERLLDYYGKRSSKVLL